jgi:hypothetical protein
MSRRGHWNRGGCYARGAGRHARDRSARQRMTMAARPTLVADIVMLLVRMKPTTPNAP